MKFSNYILESAGDSWLQSWSAGNGSDIVAKIAANPVALAKLASLPPKEKAKVKKLLSLSIKEKEAELKQGAKMIKELLADKNLSSEDREEVEAMAEIYPKIQVMLKKMKDALKTSKTSVTEGFQRLDEAGVRDIFSGIKNFFVVRDLKSAIKQYFKAAAYEDVVRCLEVSTTLKEWLEDYIADVNIVLSNYDFKIDKAGMDIKVPKAASRDVKALIHDIADAGKFNPDDYSEEDLKELRDWFRPGKIEVIFGAKLKPLNAFALQSANKMLKEIERLRPRGIQGWDFGRGYDSRADAWCDVKSIVDADGIVLVISIRKG